MDEDQRQVGGFEPGDDDTSPEVTAIRRASVGTDPGPAPEDQVVVLHDVEEDATGALDVQEAADEREGDVSADEIDRAGKELDRITASAVADIDSALEHKERELLEG